jgi:hypothetical protein
LGISRLFEQSCYDTFIKACPWDDGYFWILFTSGGEMGKQNDNSSRMPNLEGGAYDYHKEDEDQDPRERQNRQQKGLSESDQNKDQPEKDRQNDQKKPEQYHVPLENDCKRGSGPADNKDYDEGFYGSGYNQGYSKFDPKMKERDEANESTLNNQDRKDVDHEGSA